MTLRAVGGLTTAEIAAAFLVPEGLLVEALRMGPPGPYQLWAAIAACHSTAASAAATDWRQISVLYSELLKYDPNPVTEANRAIAVAMAEGPAAGRRPSSTWSSVTPSSRRGPGSMSPAPTCWPGWAATTRRPGRTAPRWNWSPQRPNGATSSAAWPGTDTQPTRLVHR